MDEQGEVGRENERKEIVRNRREGWKDGHTTNGATATAKAWTQQQKKKYIETGNESAKKHKKVAK